MNYKHLFLKKIINIKMLKKIYLIMEKTLRH